MDHVVFRSLDMQWIYKTEKLSTHVTEVYFLHRNLPHNPQVILILKQGAFEQIVRKVENSGNLFPPVFSTLSRIEVITFVTLNLFSANVLNLVQEKILLFLKL